MPDVLASAATWLSGQLQAHASQAVTYGRGAQSAALQMRPGPAALVTTDREGNTKAERAERDFDGAVADLTAAGLWPPKRGDRVAYGPELYEVTAEGHEAPWRYLDGYRVDFRVRAKKTSASAPAPGGGP